MQHVPLKTGVPGVTARVTQGSRVLVGWEDGDPRKPFASLWSSETATKIVATCDDIRLGEDGLSGQDGVLTGQSTDPSTGFKFGWFGVQSGTVKAKGP